MCEFRCDTCVAVPFVTTRYEDWVTHLVSEGHQSEARKRLSQQKRWSDEGDTFVLTATEGGNKNRLPWTLEEIAEWVAKFGVLTQFLYNEHGHFCIFTLQIYGKELRKDLTLSLSSQKEFRNHGLIIKSKTTYILSEWNSLLDSVDNNTSHAQSATSNSISKSSVPAAISGPSSQVSAKGTLVFTNKSVQSFPSKSVPPDTNAKTTNMRNSSDLPVNDSSSSHVKKVKKKVKDKKGPKLQDRQESASPSESSTPSSSSRRTSKETMVLPSSLITPEVKKDLSGSGNSNTKGQQQPAESYSFRGGFTPSGRIQQNGIDFGESSHQTVSVVSEKSSSSTTANLSTNKIQKPASQEHPPVTILKRTVVNDNFRDDSKTPTSRKQNGLQQQQKHQPRQQQQQHHSNSQIGASALPHSNRFPPKHAHSYPIPSQPPNIILSPTFTSQLMPEIAACLVNPLFPGSRNPYKFTNMPPIPQFFDLFQKLPDENFKPQKHNLYRQFHALSLHEQLDQFFHAQTLIFDEVRLRWQIILDIMFLLRHQFPRCELYAFGSIITGLGDVMSDIDLYVDLVGQSTCPKPHEAPLKMSSHDAVDTVKKILRKSFCPHTNNRFVQMLIPVKSARVPILKITHSATKINCDLSFENRLSVQNTKMLHFYLNFDPRIFHFMVLIRYWAKYHHLTGSNHIKNYALTLLVLVYLTKKGYVPSLELLQRLKEEERKKQRNSRNPDEIDGWDASFCDNLSVIKQHFKAASLPASTLENNSKNKQASYARTLVQMTIEFFEMFANQNLGSVVVCPLLGVMLPREKFHPGNEETLPDTLDRYKTWSTQQKINKRLNINTPFCVMDPFVLSYNVGSVTPLGILIKFQIACAKGLQILQTNELKSFLDVLNPLPAHIGEKKFMKAHKTEVKGEELRREIKMNVLGSTNVVAEQHSVGTTKQANSYVRLPEHLASLDKLIDEKGLKQATKRPRWEIFLDFSLGSQFEDTYLAELYRCQVLLNKRNDIMNSLCSLWVEFAQDFVKQFFEGGLKLRLVKEREKKTLETAYVSEDFGSNGIKPHEIEEDSVRKRWKVKMASPQERELLLRQAKAIGWKSEERAKELSKKITELPGVPAPVQYYAYTYSVDYPFWERRPSLLDKVVKEIKVGDMFEIPVLPTPKRKERRDRGKRNRHEKQEPIKEDSVQDAGRQVWRSFNPLDLETRVSEIVAESTKKEFTSFNLDILIKLDSNWATDRPEIFFIFEKDSDDKHNSDEYLRAVQCIATILTEAFPRYQIYRLAKWLDMPVASDIKVDTALAVEVTTPSKIVEGKLENRKSEEVGVENKRKVRTQLEEDLLIPSSSSTSSGSDEDDDDDKEEEDGEKAGIVMEEVDSDNN